VIDYLEKGFEERARVRILFRFIPIDYMDYRKSKRNANEKSTGGLGRRLGNDLGRETADSGIME